ncbi:MAG: NADH-quinone oxidoreductase subunit J family protein [Acidimicrobiales bacterium]
MVAQNLFFYGFAAVMLFSAIRVVTSANVVHAALYLVVVLASIAAQFVLLAAEFVAATQVLVYIGAIIVLFLFGIMLTRAKIGRDQDLTHAHWWSGAVTALLLFGVMAYALIDEFGWSEQPLPADTRIASVDGSNTATVSDSIFSTYLVPFEAVSVLLLAALVGAIVLARKD